MYVHHPRFPREKLLPGQVLCEHCTAKCCRYFALPIDTPESRADLDLIRWYLLHAEATVFIEDETWYLLVHTTCRKLRSDHLCGIYEIRPQICRDYTTEECEYDDQFVYDHYFETPEQLYDYMDALYPVESGNFRSPPPALLPVLV